MMAKSLPGSTNFSKAKFKKSPEIIRSPNKGYFFSRKAINSLSISITLKDMAWSVTMKSVKTPMPGPTSNTFSTAPSLV